MKKLTAILTAVLMIAFTAVPLKANGLSLNSVGTRALGMGGAFVGLANDGSAIYWNPAGLAGLDSRVYLYGTFIMPNGYYKNGPVDASLVNNVYPAPGLFVNYSLDNMAFGLGVYVPAGIGAEWNTSEFGYPSQANLELMSQIGVINISPAFAYQISENLSLGVAVNVSYAMFDMKQPVMQDVNGDGIPEFFQYDESSDGLGFGATFGLKYNFNPELSFGATVRLASKVSMSGTAKNNLFPALPNFPPAVMPGPGESDFDRDVTWPLWISGGFAYKPNDKLTLVLDAQFSQWSELDELVTEYNDAYWKLAMSVDDGNKFILKWEDKVQIRAGAEYQFSPCFTGRVGYYYDPAPAPDETVNILFPSSTNHVLTGGLTYSTGKVQLEAAAEYLFGAEREVTQGAHNMGGKHLLNVFSFSVGVGYNL
ncbi:OmpP1/FadL family transporter [Melioribacter sp. Ez-97]|uniref:OmpP1/FadL family transporter n=1 Tax=Melioribacter sp. Ez-97 TaxID=3423434 RepID=UPI003EDA4796